MANTCVSPQIVLRPYQARALADARAAVQAGAQGVCIVAPTGTGKTRMGVAACVGHRHQGGPLPLWVAPRKELLTQASAALRAAGLEPEIDVLVRTNQELARPGSRVPDAALVVWDESHHAGSDTWSLLRGALPGAVFLGLTATPERGDGRGLTGVFDALVTAITIRDAIAGGFLVPAEVVRPDRALAPGELAQDPVDAYLEHCPSARAVLFAPSVQLAIQYTCSFRERGVTAAAAWGEMQTRDRVRVIEDFAEGRTSVLSNAALLTEGFDVPACDAVILARGFGTAGSYLQAVGRGLRIAEGKDRCTVLDLRGVSHVHGDPDVERTYHLDGKAIRRAGDEIDVRFCPVCGTPQAGPPPCETCGHEGEMRLRRPRVLGLPMTRFAALRAEDDDARVLRLARWLRHAAAKGWREGQALHRFKGAYGEWPSASVKARAAAIAREMAPER